MFSDIMTWLGDNVSAVFELLGDVLAGPIAMFWTASPDAGVTPSELTELGELLLMGALIGLAYFAIRFVRSMIPFLK